MVRRLSGVGFRGAGDSLERLERVSPAKLGCAHAALIISCAGAAA